LFRHEIAYVLGQMQHPVSIPALAEVLKTKEEHAMVRDIYEIRLGRTLRTKYTRHEISFNTPFFFF